MIIGVTGATGQLGRLAIKAIAQRAPDSQVIALARSPAQANDLGVAVRRADYRDRNSLDAALPGIDVLVLISSSDFNDRPGQHRAVIEAAQAAGVGRIVYTSILKADRSPLLVAADHRETEAMLHAASIASTILRNPWYVENWTASLPAAIAAGALIGCAGTALVSPATRADLADAIAAAATSEGNANRTYELGCDTPFTLSDLAAEVSRQSGKTIPYLDMPKDQYLGVLAGFGLPPGLPEVIADADAAAAAGWLLEESGTLSTLIGRPTTPLQDVVTAALA